MRRYVQAALVREFSRRDFLEATVAGFHHAGCGNRPYSADSSEHEENGMNAACADHEAHERGTHCRRNSQPGCGEAGSNRAHARGINFRSVEVKNRVDRTDQAVACLLYTSDAADDLLCVD